MLGHVKVGAAQLNCAVGDLAGNSERIFRAAERAAAAGVGILLTPELSVCGYPPEDLLLREDFVADCAEALASLAARLAAFPALDVIVGFPERTASGLCNAAALLRGGKVAGTHRKRELPDYSVFDEERWFVPGTDPLVFDRDGVRFGVAVCEDLWLQDTPARIRDAGGQVLLAVNASPYFRGKTGERLDAVRRNVSSLGLACAYCNLVGGQDELVFDGGSFFADAAGRVRAAARPFEEGLLVCDLAGGDWSEGPRAEPMADDEATWQALVLAVRDYVGKNGFPGVVVGLSGGVDSALTLAIAVDALGADRCRAVRMPSRYTADISLEDAGILADNLGVRCVTLPIEKGFGALRETLAGEFRGLPEDLTEENLQARVRGMLLMAISNKTGSLVLTTGNKSETAVGYSTLYGDLAGGFAVIKDVPKMLVYALCRLRNARAGFPLIPERILTRAPSAELREGQTDQQSLPEYPVLDEIIRLYVEMRESVANIVARGFDEKTVVRVVGMIRRAEFKRRQSPVGPKVSPLGFGRDWRFPITNAYGRGGRR